MKHTLITLALIVTASTAQAGETLTPGQAYCTHLGWTWKGVKCADVAAAAKVAASNAGRYERKAKKADNADEAQQYRNKAAFAKAEAERLAAKWHRKYGTK